jgi:hypothetical protein
VEAGDFRPRDRSPTREASVDPPQGRGGDPPQGRTPASIHLEAMAATRLEVATAGRELKGGGRGGSSDGAQIER